VELLLQHINSIAPAQYRDVENEKIAAFIMGNEDFEAIKPILKRMEHFNYDDTVTRRIGKEVSRNNELLPAFGRYMIIIDYVTRKKVSLHFQILSGILKGGLPVDKVYVESGKGADYMLSIVLRAIYSYTWDIPPKSLSCSSYQEFFEKMLAKYPEGFIKLSEEKSYEHLSFFADVFLYAQDPEKYACCEDKIINLSAALIKGKRTEIAFSTVGKEPYFANNSFIQALLNSEKNQATAQKKDRNYIDMFSLAYLMSPQGNELLDLIQYLLIYVNKIDSLNAIQRMYSYTNDNKAVFDKLLDSFHKGLYPKAQFLSYFCDKIYQSLDEYSIMIQKQLRKLAFEYEEDALEAVSMSGIKTSVFYLSAFWEQGKHLDKVAAVEKEVLRVYLSTKDIEAREKLKALLSGETPQNSDENLPVFDIDGHFLASLNALLSIASPLPSRFSEYSMDVILSANSSYSHMNYFNWLLSSIQRYYGEKAAEEFLDGLNRPTKDKITLLLELFSYHFGTNKDKDTLKNRVIALGDMEAVENAFEHVSADGRVILLEIIIKSSFKPEFLIKCLSDGSKKVRDLAVVYLTPKVELKEQIEELLKSKKKAVRECAEKLMLAYNATDSSASNNDGEFDALAYCLGNIPKSAAKTIAWAGTLPTVRLLDSETLADDRVIQGYVYLVVSQTEMAFPRPAAMIRETLNKRDLQALGMHIYHIWKADGAVAKRSTALVLAAIDGDDAFVNMLKQDIQNWADSSRGALAAKAVRALALQGGNLALMTVDAMSKKFNNKQVKRVAEEAFTFAAEQLGVDPEVLGDRIVPTLGFDHRGEQTIDYGNRQFTATITPDLQIGLKNDKGKAIKSLPTPGVSDDKEKATVAKAAFSAMKKSLKSVTAIQCTRLEMALSSNRTWSKTEWNKLFIENPIMNMFAIGLVWGTYDESGKLVDSFRYMEDGSFVIVDEDEIEIADDAAIGLCHPLDLGDELLTLWVQQLDDYEIKQPVEQLSRKVYKKGTGETITEFGGAVVYAISLAGKLQKLGWHKGSVLDGGWFHNFYKEDKKHGIGVWLEFSGAGVQMDSADESTIYDATFYKAGTIEYGSYVYDEISEENKLPLSQIPERFYSEVCYDIERATANRIDTVKNWVKS